MTGLAITITNAGLAALTAAKGSNAITIASVGLTAASFTPAANATALPGEIKRLTTFSGEVADAYTVHLSVRDESTDSYNLRGFGLYLSGGTLFGIYGGGDTLIMEKAAASILLLAVDLNFSESTATAITFGDTNFLNPPATTEVQGVVELATETEATTGTDAKRAVTPKGMLAAVTKWLDDRLGAGAPSAFIKTLLVKTGAADMLAALGIKSAALEDVSAFAAASHKHAITDVTSLQVTLDAKLPITSYTAADVLAKLTGVDGPGSGLDADTLDGVQAAQIAKSDNFGPYIPDYNNGAPTDCNTCNPGVYTLTAGRHSPGGGWGVIECRRGGTSANTPYDGGDSWFSQTVYCTDNNVYVRFNTNSATAWTPWYTFWHSGNDGPGSSLDADMLDGCHASQFVRADANTFGAARLITPASDVVAPHLYLATGYGGDLTTIRAWNWNINTGGGLDLYGFNGSVWGRMFAIDAAGNASVTGNTRAERFIAGWDSGSPGSMSCSNWFRSTGATGWYNDTYQGGWYMADETWVQSYSGKSVFTAGVMRADSGFRCGTGGVFDVWHTGNDGPGSGMDADTLDGYHADSFARVVAASGNQSSGYRVWSDGFKECWGVISASTRSMTVYYPISFTSWALASCDAGRTGDARVPFVAGAYTTYLTLYNPSDGGLTVTWRAWGY